MEKPGLKTHRRSFIGNMRRQRNGDVLSPQRNAPRLTLFRLKMSSPFSWAFRPVCPSQANLAWSPMRSLIDRRDWRQPVRWIFPGRDEVCRIDGIVLHWRSPKPAILWIKDGKSGAPGCEPPVGKLTGEAEDIIKQELGDDKVEIAQIGPAGENGVRYASIMNMVNRSNGRTGRVQSWFEELEGGCRARHAATSRPPIPRKSPSYYRDGTKRIPDTPASAIFDCARHNRGRGRRPGDRHAPHPQHERKASLKDSKASLAS